MRIRAALAIAACLAVMPASASADPASFVRPLSGTLGSGFPMVGASVPFGLIQPGPDTGLADGSEDPVNYCGYGYQDTTIRGFSLTHFDGAGIKIAGDVPFMPVTGTPAGDAQQDASPYEHATELAEPGYYAVTLAKYDTRVELTSALPLVDGADHVPGRRRRTRRGRSDAQHLGREHRDGTHRR